MGFESANSQSAESPPVHSRLQSAALSALRRKRESHDRVAVAPVSVPRKSGYHVATMDLRIRNLEQLDERAVPLPHGTEVMTRVDRIVGEKRIPQGSVGRVTRVAGDDIDVTL